MKTRGKLIVAFAAGWTAGYYLDVDRGYARRVELSQQCRHACNRAIRQANRLIRHSASEAEGAIERVMHAQPAPPADDLTLLDRVKSEIFARRDVPKGELTLDVAKGVVSVHGQVRDADEMVAVLDAVHRVAGVQRVRNLMHLPGTPAPNKAASIRIG